MNLGLIKIPIDSIATKTTYQNCFARAEVENR